MSRLSLNDKGKNINAIDFEESQDDDRESCHHTPQINKLIKKFQPTTSTSVAKKIVIKDPH